MIERLPIENCTGCSACAMVCAINCIHMVADREGFLRPEVDDSKCAHCGKCLRTCSVSKAKTTGKPIASFAVQGKDWSFIKKSASGGVFTMIARFVLCELKGVVFGCLFNENMKACHVEASTIDEIRSMQGSKYVQSDMGDCFHKVEENLKAGRWVLFSGTPCQVTGLYSYLEISIVDFEKLITIDNICHGVPSPALFERYIDELSKGKRGRVISFSFRRKKKHKRSLYISTIGYLRRKIIIPSAYDPYYKLFLSGKTFRPSCYHCPYANVNRVGDFTMGDCDSWKGLKHFKNEAVSTLLVNTKKAQILWEERLSILFNSERISIETEAKYNKQLQAPFPEPLDRDSIYQQLETMSWTEIQEKYSLTLTKNARIKLYLIPLVPKFILRYKNK